MTNKPTMSKEVREIFKEAFNMTDSELDEAIREGLTLGEARERKEKKDK